MNNSNFFSSTPGGGDGLRPTPRRGRPPSFTAEQAVRAALRIGVADFTMAGVASAVGVTAPALNRLFPTRSSLMIAALREIFRDPLLTEADSWRSALEEFATSLWGTFSRYPGSHRAITMIPLPPGALLPSLRQVTVQLQEHGYTYSQSVFACAHILFYCMSSVGSMQRQQDYFDNCEETDPGRPALAVAGGPVMTSRRDIEVHCRHQWQTDVAFFLDSLENIDPHWPDWVAPNVHPCPTTEPG